MVTSRPDDEAPTQKQLRNSYSVGKWWSGTKSTTARSFIKVLVTEEYLVETEIASTDDMVLLGRRELAQGAVGAVILTAGVDSRWTQNTGVVIAIYTFFKLGWYSSTIP